MRAAVVFRHVYDLSVSDTAEALGCSEGNVKSQTARGLERLRAALSPTSLSHPGAPHERPREPAQPGRSSRQPGDPALVDADVARGRRALSHRRMRNTGGRRCSSAPSPSAALPSSTPREATPTARRRPRSPARWLPRRRPRPTPWSPRTSPSGWSPTPAPSPRATRSARCPRGWEIQGVNNYSLDIAPSATPTRTSALFRGQARRHAAVQGRQAIHGR